MRVVNNFRRRFGPELSFLPAVYTCFPHLRFYVWARGSTIPAMFRHCLHPSAWWRLNPLALPCFLQGRCSIRDENSARISSQRATWL